jgi:hypothetical protein
MEHRIIERKKDDRAPDEFAVSFDVVKMVFNESSVWVMGGGGTVKIEVSGQNTAG